MPGAVALTLIAAISILSRVIAVAVEGAPVPFEGTARVLFHIESASQLAGDATIAGLALAVAVGLERRRWAVAIVGGVWLLASVVIAALYPSPLVRGAGLARVYFASTVLGLCVATLSLVTRARSSLAVKRSPDGVDLLAITLTLLDATIALVPFSPWRSAPFSAESFSGPQVLIIGVFTIITAVEVVAWLLIRGSHG
jgi:hypothetical protein